jgi:predicted membrane channel-forming protein YqfA (hemolysin III family)
MLQMTDNQDTEQLRQLSIFHYVVAGILGVFSLIPILHVIIGIAIINGALDGRGNGNYQHRRPSSRGKA